MLGGYRFAEILSNDAGAFLQAAGLIKRGAEGKLNLRINRNADGIKGRLFTESLKIYDLPALAKLLQSLSIIGLLEQMLGQGLLHVHKFSLYNPIPLPLKLVLVKWI